MIYLVFISVLLKFLNIKGILVISLIMEFVGFTTIPPSKEFSSAKMNEEIGNETNESLPDYTGRWG